MTVEMIPKQYRFTCDFCDHSLIQERDGAPDGWGWLKEIGLRDPELLCPRCIASMRKGLEQNR